MVNFVQDCSIPSFKSLKNQLYQYASQGEFIWHEPPIHEFWRGESREHDTRNHNCLHALLFAYRTPPMPQRPTVLDILASYFMKLSKNNYLRKLK